MQWHNHLKNTRTMKRGRKLVGQDVDKAGVAQLVEVGVVSERSHQSSHLVVAFWKHLKLHLIKITK
jgi:hypothetical protein